MEDKKSILLKILEARELRAAKQKELINNYKCALICFTLNIPGAEKNGLLYERIHKEGMNSLLKAIMSKNGHVRHLEVNTGAAGMEAYLNVELNSCLLKRIAVQIEDEHPLGRLFDFDVLNESGELLSRDSIGKGKRKCLLCDKDAIICARSKSHSLKELLDRIDIIAKGFFGDE